MIDTRSRAALLAQGAAEWRDASSAVRVKARSALLESQWSAPVIEAALDDVLWDLDENRARAIVRDRPPSDPRPVLVILPGNIIGPAIACSYCAAAAGASAILKPAGAERSLGTIVAEQFTQLGPPFAGTIVSHFWKGGDELFESPAFPSARRIVAFGEDATIEELRRRAPTAIIVGYGEAVSVGIVFADADVASAAIGAARDICIFDQRGCMSPQTIYVEGDDGRALLFAHALASALVGASSTYPRGQISDDEAAAAAAAIRRFAVTSLPPKTHGLDTLIVGPTVGGAPQFVVAVEPPGPPTCEGFGRIVVIKACADVGRLADCLEKHVGDFDTIGYAGNVTAAARELLGDWFTRVCPLGEMQRPPFGYRPAVEDFA